MICDIIRKKEKIIKIEISHSCRDLDDEKII